MTLASGMGAVSGLGIGEGVWVEVTLLWALKGDAGMEVLMLTGAADTALV